MPNPNAPMTKTMLASKHIPNVILFGTLGFKNFEFVSSFEFRVSDFRSPGLFTLNNIVTYQGVCNVEYLLSIFQVTVSRVGGESRIFDRSANGEMVQTLILIIFKSQHLMDGIVKETADAGAANTVRFGLQI